MEEKPDNDEVGRFLDEIFGYEGDNLDEPLCNGDDDYRYSVDDCDR